MAQIGKCSIGNEIAKARCAPPSCCRCYVNSLLAVIPSLQVVFSSGCSGKQLETETQRERERERERARVCVCVWDTACVRVSTIIDIELPNWAAKLSICYPLPINVSPHNAFDLFKYLKRAQPGRNHCRAHPPYAQPKRGNAYACMQSLMKLFSITEINLAPWPSG